MGSKLIENITTVIGTTVQLYFLCKLIEYIPEMIDVMKEHNKIEREKMRARQQRETTRLNSFQEIEDQMVILENDNQANANANANN